MSIIVRPYVARDAARVEEICRETAAERPFLPFVNDPRLAWFFHAKPYVVLEPASSLVAELGGEVVGYLVGTSDTLGFQRKLAGYLAGQLPELLRLHVAGTLRGGHRQWAAQRAFFRFYKEISLGQSSAGESVVDLAAYPAHCHLQVTASARDQRVGLMLMLRFHQELKSAGSRGQHCSVVEPVGRDGYSRMMRAFGFSTLRETSFTRADRPTLVDSRVWQERIMVRAF